MSKIYYTAMLYYIVIQEGYAYKVFDIMEQPHSIFETEKEAREWARKNLIENEWDCWEICKLEVQ